MKAAIYRRGEIVVDTVPDPVPGPGQVLVRSLVCGVCGSDLHYRHHAHRFVDLALRSGAPALAANLDRDIVLGHEFSAQVVDYGPKTERLLKTGTVVCSPPVAFGAGGMRAVGYSDELPGGFGQYMVLNEAFLMPAPNGLDPARAALTEPMAVGWHAVKLAQPGRDHIPLVIGCGPVGMAVIAALRGLGVGPIIAADFNPARRSLAARMGADIVIDPAERSPYDEWRDTAAASGLAGLAGAPTSLRTCLIFECVGLPGMLRQIMEGAPAESEIIVVGACMEPDSLEPMMAMHKALTLKFSRTYTIEEFAEVLRMIGEGELHVEPLLSQPIGLEDLPGVFDEAPGSAGGAKVLVDPWR